MAWYYILLIIICGAFLLVLLFSIIVSCYLVHFISYPIRYETSYTYKIDLDKGLINNIDMLKREKFELKMSDGYLIHGDISINDPHKFVILTHGYTWTREGDLKYAKIFYEKGYSNVLYDVRSHGENVHKDVTMGYKEAKDLHEIIRYIREKYGEDVEIGLHGESMGAAISLLVLNYNDKLSFVIADSSYSSLKDLVSYKLRTFHLPQFLIPMCSLFLKIAHHYYLKDVDVIKAIKDKTLPILLIQGDKDTFIPPSEGQALHDANKGSILKYFKDADHAQSVIMYPEEYKNLVFDFLNNINKERK